jgi:PhnB protein
MNISTYLNFNGECARALSFYEQAIGARVLFKMTWGESPMAKDCPPETHGLIMHSTLAIGDGQIMCADSPPDSYKKPAGINVSLHVKDKAEGERLFKALSAGGNITMPFEKTFWSPGFGMCVDQFGIPWMINTEGEIES